MVLHKVAWGQMVLWLICVLVYCCKRLNACMHTACQGICINVESSLEPFFTICLKVYSSVNLFSHSAYIQQSENCRSTFHPLSSASKANLKPTIQLTTC